MRGCYDRGTNKEVRRIDMTVIEYTNGFMKVDGEMVQGVRNALRPRIADANDSRPACTCNFYHVKKLPKGFCPHINAAFEWVKANA
jgi:hypothetical protein